MNESVYYQGVQITATTPTSSAVRLETGSVELEVSNRVLMATAEAKDKRKFYTLYIYIGKIKLSGMFIMKEQSNK